MKRYTSDRRVTVRYAMTPGQIIFVICWAAFMVLIMFGVAAVGEKSNPASVGAHQRQPAAKASR